MGISSRKKVRHKLLVTVRPFTGAKTASEKTVSQIARSITELAMTLKDNDNSVVVSGIVSRNDNLNNKATEVNNRLLLMCKERKIPFIAHSENIDSSKHLNESKLHLNHNGIKVFAENFSVFLKKLN